MIMLSIDYKNINNFIFYRRFTKNTLFFFSFTDVSGHIKLHEENK